MPEHLLDTPCRTRHRSEIWAIPSLCRATPSATSEHLVELLGSSPIPRSFAASCVSFQLRPLPSTRITRFRRYCEPLRHPSRPGLSLTSCQLIHPAITAGTSRVAYGPLCLHAVANTPAGSMEFVRSYHSTVFGLPSNLGTGRLLHYAFRGLLSVHSRYGLQFAKSPSRPSAPKASAASLPPLLLRLLPGGANQFPGGFTPAVDHRLFHGAPGYGVTQACGTVVSARGSLM